MVPRTSEKLDIRACIRTRRLVAKDGAFRFDGTDYYLVALPVLYATFLFAPALSPSTPGALPLSLRLILVAALLAFGIWMAVRMRQNNELRALGLAVPDARERGLAVAQALGWELREDTQKYARFLARHPEFGDSIVTLIYVRRQRFLINVSNRTWGTGSILVFRWPVSLKQQREIIRSFRVTLESLEVTTA